MLSLEKYIDFLGGKLGYRSHRISKKNELIAKAVGIKPKQILTVLDVTAGLGRDAWILSQLECRVTMLERSPVVAEMLREALNRAYQSDANSNIPKLIEVDSKRYLLSLNKDDYPDVIYIDPMYPERTKSALVKKEMRLLREIVGTDDDYVELFELSLQRAKKRVVVKRPRLADYIKNIKPTMSYIGRSCRFDVYILN